MQLYTTVNMMKITLSFLSLLLLLSLLGFAQAQVAPKKTNLLSRALRRRGHFLRRTSESRDSSSSDTTSSSSSSDSSSDTTPAATTTTTPMETTTTIAPTEVACGGVYNTPGERLILNADLDCVTQANLTEGPFGMLCYSNQCFRHCPGLHAKHHYRTRTGVTSSTIGLFISSTASNVIIRNCFLEEFVVVVLNH